MDKPLMHSKDMTADNVSKIAALFPNCVTEHIDSEGNIVQGIDFDKLQQELSADLIKNGEERYQFTWPGKMAAIREANRPTNCALRPDVGSSVDFWNTKNLYIEGDNLEVLKLLQENYLGKVKMIYIDPPYNTGNDFIYNDDFSESIDTYSQKAGLFDADGNMLLQKYEKNLEGNGRFHSDWLNMIYCRLKIARNLLSDNGVIFISINDKEEENLKKVCNEIFGESNHLATFCWRTDGNFDNQAKVKICHEYILMYTKNESLFIAPKVIDPNIPLTSKLYRNEIRNTIIKNGPKNPISEVIIPSGFPCEANDGVIEVESINWPRYSSDIIVEKGRLTHEVRASSGWAAKAQLLDFISNGFNPVTDSKGQSTRFVISKSGAIESVKTREETSHIISVLENLGGPQKATADMGELGIYFDYPKPLALIKYLCSMAPKEDCLILDFFSGSGTTADAILKLCAEDGIERKFILVQLPETTSPDSIAYKDGYNSICKIGEERIRRAGKKIKEDNPQAANHLDTGFRVLKLDSSNMKDVYYNPAETAEINLFDTVSNIKDDRTPMDLLFQVMLEKDIPLSAKIEEKEIMGKKVFFVEDNYLIATFDAGINEELVKEIANMKPYNFTMANIGIENDSLVDNFEQIFKALSPQTTRDIL